MPFQSSPSVPLLLLLLFTEQEHQSPTESLPPYLLSPTTLNQQPTTSLLWPNTLPPPQPSYWKPPLTPLSLPLFTTYNPVNLKIDNRPRSTIFSFVSTTPALVAAAGGGGCWRRRNGPEQYSTWCSIDGPVRKRNISKKHTHTHTSQIRPFMILGRD